ncbi:hypothetical protein, partial [Methylobacterium isbiliense]
APVADSTDRHAARMVEEDQELVAGSADLLAERGSDRTSVHLRAAVTRQKCGPDQCARCRCSRFSNMLVHARSHATVAEDASAVLRIEQQAVAFRGLKDV